MSFSLFQPNVNFIVGSNTYDIPITNMRVNSGPYSREVGDGTAIRAFDGRFYQKHQGWRSRAVFDWPEMTPASQQTFYDFIVDLATTGVCTVVFNPEGVGTTIDMVLEDPTQALKAQFTLNARSRPASITMLSSNILSSAPFWITGDDGGDAIMWIGDDGDYYVTSGDLAVTRNTGLDVSSLSSPHIDFHPIQNRVFAMKNGVVYSWAADGSGSITTEFDTGFGDIQGIHVDSDANEISATSHNLALFNNRYKKFSLATGVETFDTEFRIGVTSYSLEKGQWHHSLNRTYFANTAAVIYIQPNPLEKGGLGCISHLACQDLCLDEQNNLVFHLCSPGIYYQADDIIQTGPCADNDTFLATVPNSSDQIDIYELGGTRWLVGGGAGSFRVQTNGQNGTTGWHSGTGTGIASLCTRRPLS